MIGDDYRAGRPPGWDIPPWELPGNFRLDAKPHHGPLLRQLANAAFICAVASYYPCVCFLGCCILRSVVKLVGPAFLLGMLGAVFALPVCLVAQRDLWEMERGRTRRDGEFETRFGRDRAALASALGLFSFLLWGSFVLSDCLGFGITLP
jgi:hypothetical protein